METEQILEERKAFTHYLVAFIGGFLGIFPIVNSLHLFGSAQTSNLIDIVIGSLGGDWKSVILHSFGAFLYVLAVFLVTFIPKHTKLNVKILAMLVDILAALCMWLFPLERNLPLLSYMYPTFFAMAFQWSSFTGAYGYTSSTIFSSNNLRQFISSLTEIFFNRDETFKIKAKFFGLTLLAFHLGVALSFFTWKFFGNRGFLFAIIPATLVLVRIVRNK
ncbi:MAG: DUF1275 domain-containing protein [Treponema sp.]|nr:DUF1275 domain-containing protein [Treponema sp.]